MMEMSEFPNIVQLNVGGQTMATKLSTLTKDPNSLLAAVFTGKATVEKDNEGRYFIDCESNIFALILEFLRFGTVPQPDKAVDVYRYAKIFRLQGLMKTMDKFYPVQLEDRMSKIFEQFEGKRSVYEELKDKVLIDICDVNCFDNTLIPIVFILNDEKEACGKDHSLMVSSQLANIGEVKTLKGLSDRCIPMQTLYINDARDISKCLAYELCGLGYCKQGFYFEALTAQSCRNRANCGFSWKLEFVYLSRHYYVENIKWLKRP
ncbi:uncharacterized protein LOC123532239 [Mercenaria mercenaria]|uniref:uncharacterized protein LOC123532239 n=1 Tax=Mercenaria mercenaria TaxID=6596 RepID=UPI001E1D7BE9|nr:uncharacterized protein LOC123532239 [Mercenaria mercenaria]